MKQKRIFLLLVAIIACSLLFTSCSNTVSTTDYLNESYDRSSDILTKHSVVLDTETRGYTLTDSNDEFAVFSKVDGINTLYKVFGMNAGKIISSFEDLTFSYTIELFDGPYNIPVFLVKQVDIDDAKTSEVSPLAEITEDVLNIDYTYTLYDAQGNEIRKTTHEPDDPFMFTKDILIYDFSAYKVGDDGTLKKDVDIPEYLLIDECDYYTDTHYYITDDDSVTVFDKKFNAVLTYTVPDYIFSASFYPLNNGDIFVQYLYIVDEDNEEFDVSLYYGTTTHKLNVVSLIVSLKDGDTKELDLEHYIVDISTCTSLRNHYDDNNNKYTEDFDNIAVIAPIEETMLDTSEANCDVVYMSNKGKLGKSLKIVDNQTNALPYLIGDGLYMVETLSGSAIVDEDGEIVKTLQNKLEQVGKYFVGKQSLYNLKLESIYNLYDNNAEVIGSVADSVFVKAKTDTGYDIIVFVNGEHKTVCTYKEDDVKSPKFEFEEDFGYSIFDPQTKKYKYHNAKGDVILESEVSLTVLCVSYEHDTVLLKGSDDTCHAFTVE